MILYSELYTVLRYVLFILFDVDIPPHNGVQYHDLRLCNISVHYLPSCAM